MPRLLLIMLLLSLALTYASAEEATFGIVLPMASGNALTLHPGTTLSLPVPSSPVTPGTAVVGLNSSTTLQYSSTGNKNFRTIVAKLAGTALPAWLKLECQITPPAGCGVTAGWVTMTTTAQSVVTGVSSAGCDTGSPGPAVNYRVTITNWSAAKAASVTGLQVQFNWTS